MNTNDLNTALYEKMAAEQDKYRDWLKSQPPAEVLNHAYEYTVREDIVIGFGFIHSKTQLVHKFFLDSLRRGTKLPFLCKTQLLQKPLVLEL